MRSASAPPNATDRWLELIRVHLNQDDTGHAGIRNHINTVGRSARQLAIRDLGRPSLR